MPLPKRGSHERKRSRLPSRELSALLEVGSALAASLDLPSVLQTAIARSASILELQSGAIYLLEGENLYLGATTPPLPADFPEDFRLARLDRHPHIDKALRNAAPVYIADARKARLTKEEMSIIRARGLISLLYIPLLLEEKPIGVLIVGSTRKVRHFTPHEIELCQTLSSQVTLAVANARLYQDARQANEELRRAYDATLEGWSMALEMRDENTEGHTQRVAGMTLALARRMGIPDNSLEHIRRGALLHDIGKMSIPDAILQSKGRLKGAEREIMKKHPELAYQFLVKIDYLLPALNIPYCHHERWDGSGYPRGLKGTEIPLSARIFSVVDVYDALTCDRPYRRGWPRERALEYIREEAGRQFDPEVVEVFLAMMGDEMPHHKGH